MSLKPVCEKASAKCLCGSAGAKVVNARTVPKISCLNQSIRPTVLMELLKLILSIRLLLWTILYDIVHIMIHGTVEIVALRAEFHSFKKNTRRKGEIHFLPIVRKHSRLQVLSHAKSNKKQ